MKNRESLQNLFLSLLLFLISTSIMQAQNQQGLDLVQVKVISSGKTEALAVTEALRSALTQTSSVFISSNTTLINDELSKDQISMINNGSIAEFKIIDKALKDDGTVFLTCDVTVSVNKLGSFVESVGGSTELKGGLFANNIKLLELNERAEETSVRELLKVSRQLLANCFDYSITNGEPRNSNGSWEVPLQFSARYNENYKQFTKFFYSTLESISLNQEDAEAYIKLNKPIYLVGLFDNSGVNSSTPVVIITQGQPNFVGIPKVDSYRYYVGYKSFGVGLEIPLFNVSDKQSDVLSFFKSPNNKIVKFQNTEFKIENSAPDDFEPKIYLANGNSNYAKNLLRSARSFDSIKQFAINFKELIMNVELSNGLNSVKLAQVESDYRNGASYRLQGVEVSLPITCTAGKGTGYEPYRIINPSLREIADSKTSFNSVITNKQWDSKILIYSYPNEKWFTGDKYYNNADIPEQYKAQRSNTYFSLYFASYIHFDNDFKELLLRYKGNTEYDKTKSQLSNALASGNAKIEGIPLQLTMIGNEESVVIKANLINTLSTEQIAKISKYTVKAN